MKRFFSTFLFDMLDIVCPKTCISCGCHIKVENEDFLCPDCYSNYAKTPFEDNQMIVESFLQEGIEIENGCTFLKFDKKDTVQQIIHNIKYFHHPELGERFGRIAAYQLKEKQFFKSIDFILPVPMHPKKQKRRGYNQAEMIANGLSLIFDIKVRTDILKKNFNTKSQTRMNKEQRKQNSEKIYSAVIPENEDLSEKHFLIVDDVFTTGATLEVCSKRLKEKLPNCKISVFALAKA